MLLAHGVGSSGPHVEFLVVAGALLVLGVLFYIQKAVKPVVSVILILVAVALGSGAFILGGGESAAQGRSIAITDPKPGDTVEVGAPVELEVFVRGGSLVSGPSDETGGHLHVYVDGELVDMPTTNVFVELKRGRHTLMVEYVDFEHRPFTPRVKDEIEVEAR